jgi:uncharacterized protein (DUF305 family)
MQKNSIVIGVVLLIVGLGVGYGIGAAKTPPPPNQNVTSGMHMMPDGSMMGSGGMSMSDMMTEMNAELRGKTGDDLDKAFIDEMIVHHEGAVEMAKVLLAGTKRPELIKLGNDIVTAQTSEIQMMKQWRTDWFGR